MFLNSEFKNQFKKMNLNGYGGLSILIQNSINLKILQNFQSYINFERKSIDHCIITN